jgi:hypothetical protein
MTRLGMSTSPYRGLPAFAWWREGVVQSGEALNPTVNAKFSIDRGTRIATCGSCFAQHVGRFLAASGHTYLVTEAAPGILDASEAHEYQYGVFTARFGNVYTARALRQLLERAFGATTSAEPPWITSDGRVLDPLRPHVHPGGFASVDEMQFDREHHQAAVRAMVERMELLVFTLGLTEMWERRSDGTALPACPGTVAGDYDDAVYRFRNLSVEEVIGDLQRALELIGAHNRAARILLSVSPVPLVASNSGEHVLSATTYSKSVLRVAAEAVKNRHAHVDYLPAYEIVAGHATRGRYFADDLRSIRGAGVAHVMRCFFESFSRDPPAAPDESASTPVPAEVAAEDEDVIRAICDEERLERAHRAMP